METPSSPSLLVETLPPVGACWSDTAGLSDLRPPSTPSILGAPHRVRRVRLPAVLSIRMDKGQNMRGTDSALRDCRRVSHGLQKRNDVKTDPCAASLDVTV